MVIFFAMLAFGTNWLNTSMSLDRGAAFAISFVLASVAVMMLGTWIVIIWAEESAKISSN
jgi:uncharacterized membrane protein (DUF485 family)